MRCNCPNSTFVRMDYGVQPKSRLSPHKSILYLPFNPQDLSHESGRTDRRTDGQAGGRTDDRTGGLADGRSTGRTERPTDRHPGRQADRQTDRHTADRQTDRHKLYSTFTMYIFKITCDWY
ncbi:hypothetical protein DPMN_118447 [Dreissena polymorpha]|uniref:Uncharacterized protein n=1 Tax=Dreissena polymorpha TaxID=45954 RepID=A0A9D4JR35_DREPO|nr:hypothetical protein DPMN_118447 [Dreissena polymorpha]